MDATLIAALVELAKVAGLPGAIIAFVIYSAIQNRRHEQETPGADSIQKRLARIEARIEVLWSDRK